jgi:hypothetical protein
VSAVTSPEVLEALRGLQRDDGTILPADVVEHARPESSPLHRFFEWDDSAAAAEYRIAQARRLLRVTVTILPTEDRAGIPTRAFVSLTTEKGYRPTEAVLVHSDHRAQLLSDAMREAQAFARKYRHLQEMASVVAAIDRIAEA